jgi:hypothetical protein
MKNVTDIVLKKKRQKQEKIQTQQSTDHIISLMINCKREKIFYGMLCFECVYQSYCAGKLIPNTTALGEGSNER